MVMASGGGGGLVQSPPDMMHHHNIMDTSSHVEMMPKKLRLSLCVGCGGQIHDQYILRVAPDLEWHAACLKCQECRQFLDESCTCFVRDGKTYCKRDYTRLFGTKCDKCGSSFSKNDFVMRAKTKIYHIDCFRCCACARQLIPGDEFALREGGALYCREDHDVLEKSATASSGTSGNAESNNNTTLSNNNSHHPHELGSMSDFLVSADSGSESGSHKSGRARTTAAADGKPTRVRTVLNEKQLHTLRTCYAANPRPDALMKEQLVEMTGLSPRVIRVWFQNKRCKDKKKTMQLKMQMQQEKVPTYNLPQEGRRLGYMSMGVPLVAGSPVRHEPAGSLALEVTAYQPPWKALSDFALHADLDRAPQHSAAFQQLVNQMHGYDIPNLPPPRAPHEDNYVTYLESDDSLPPSP
ncbi:insulin gene enhancer protein ISL-1 isoform X1 [Spodoptera litura]|uniref:Insulin gene enhancer protein ISL-1 n=2 Tax=Spodoptera TaxID=7106 RepID=A0A9J7EX10_SPOLT|nr:insulin gene enhancer protein ISL-1 isoform X1 [Spodoptera litura]XP_035454926.1 insulin gene enhancer protein ISL-1 isoform X1 [Spodoptera frugiperda]